MAVARVCVVGAPLNSSTGQTVKIEEEVKLFMLHPQIPRTQEMSRNFYTNVKQRRSQWPRGLTRRSAAAHLLGLWVRIPPEGMDVCLW
jgi:hypothetical protein